MWSRSLGVAVTAWSLLYAAGASSQNLQVESQQELRRVYGTSGDQGVTVAPSPIVTPRPPVTSALQPESFAEFRRVFGQSTIAGSVELQRMSTPSTINSTALDAVTSSTDPLKYFVAWHLISLDLTAIDHRALLDASPTTYHEQFGPARTARALALIHQALFEVTNLFDEKYTSTLSDLGPVRTSGASADAALIEAAYEVIAWLYPGLNEQPPAFENGHLKCDYNQFSLRTYYQCSLNKITNVAERDAGVSVGRLVAGRILRDRSYDGAERVEPIFGKDLAPHQQLSAADAAFVQWQPDPVSQISTAVGGHWGDVRPFAMTSGFQFRPPETSSPTNLIRKGPNGTLDYKSLPSYAAIAKWGRESRLNRTGLSVYPPAGGDGYFVSQFWAYDGTANLCAPARLYNQIATTILGHIRDNQSDGYPGTIDVGSIVDVARFYALANFAMADAAVSAWDAKYHFQFPRPVTYIRAQEDKDAKAANQIVTTKWFPVGAQNTNSDQTFNVTPAFPSFPSGHAVFGGALFGIMRQYMKPTARFDCLSDEFNGQNKDIFNYVRCSDSDEFTPKMSKFCMPRKFSINCAERENADSRLFMGVHWVFDADVGIVMGNKVARQVYRRLMTPLDSKNQASNASSQQFSVDPALVKRRSDLLCPEITYPNGWDDEDATKGFGKLTVIAID